MLTVKEQELVEESKRYSLGVVAISSENRRGSNTVELDEEWKHFYSGDEPAQFAQAGVCIFVSPQLANCADEWIPCKEKGSTDHHLVVCNLHLENPPGPTQTQDQEILPNKVGGPGGQRCKKDFCGQRIILVPRIP